jgi:hypothetical protein
MKNLKFERALGVSEYAYKMSGRSDPFSAASAVCVLASVALGAAAEALSAAAFLSPSTFAGVTFEVADISAAPLLCGLAGDCGAVVSGEIAIGDFGGACIGLCPGDGGCGLPAVSKRSPSEACTSNYTYRSMPW